MIWKHGQSTALGFHLRLTFRSTATGNIKKKKTISSVGHVWQVLIQFNFLWQQSLRPQWQGGKKSGRSHVQHEKLPGLIGLIFEQKAQPIRSIKGRALPGIGEALAERGGEMGQCSGLPRVVFQMPLPEASSIRSQSQRWGTVWRLR